MAEPLATDIGDELESNARAEMLRAFSNQPDIDIISTVTSLVDSNFPSDTELYDAIKQVIAETKSPIARQERIKSFSLTGKMYPGATESDSPTYVHFTGPNSETIKKFMLQQLPKENIFDNDYVATGINLSDNRLLDDNGEKFVDASKSIETTKTQYSINLLENTNNVPEVLVGQIIMLFVTIYEPGPEGESKLVDNHEIYINLIFMKIRALQFIGSFMKEYYFEKVKSGKLHQFGGRQRRSRKRMTKRRRNRR